MRMSTKLGMAGLCLALCGCNHEPEEQTSDIAEAIPVDDPAGLDVEDSDTSDSTTVSGELAETMERGDNSGPGNTRPANAKIQRADPVE